MLRALSSRLHVLDEDSEMLIGAEGSDAGYRARVQPFAREDSANLSCRTVGDSARVSDRISVRTSGGGRPGVRPSMLSTGLGESSDVSARQSRSQLPSTSDRTSAGAVYTKSPSALSEERV